ncbi:MAG: NAD(P)H-dependent glycerol-3-phosphate dehydrogenase [Paracoccaceae bacterium]|nr:NAD(P)H-dependent glycerol-3-phosphate dehydrogenase [Paracoccaceae bacterium]
MTSITIFGGGAFGLSLAMALSRDGAPVTLWARDQDDAKAMQSERRSGKRLPGHDLPDRLTVTSDLAGASADVSLLAIPMQSLHGFLEVNGQNLGPALVACCKGVDLKTDLGPVATITSAWPDRVAALLTGPSFAADIAIGLPTALTLATESEADGEALQSALGRPLLRLYRTTDVVGAEIGGALKNVVALAAGMAIGAGLGDSARASVIARGFAEITRYAAAKGARLETLMGLSGLGDMVLTCTSEKSRNFAAGLALGSGGDIDRTATIEGIATASAVAAETTRSGIDMPLTHAVALVAEGRMDIRAAIEALLSRPAGKE